MIGYRALVVRTLILLLFGLAGCSDFDDNFSWVVVSNPSGSLSGSGGGATVVVRTSSSTARLSESGQDVIRVTGIDDRGPVTVLLPTQSDVAILDYGDVVRVGSPVLRQGTVDLTGAQVNVSPGGAAAVTIQVPDASEVDELGSGPGRLHVDSNGTLLALESLSGIVAFDNRENPERFAPGSTLDVSGDRFVVTTPDLRLRVLFAPPQPTPQERLVVPGDGGVRVLGPVGQAIAVLPEPSVRLRDGEQGLFFTASFPEGLNRGDPPMTLSMAEFNRYLLQVE